MKCVTGSVMDYEGTGAPLRITFGIIVLNGEPFTKYCLRSLYPFAHEIIVVEGAAPAAAPMATSGGHSTDGTLDALRQFKAEEDPDHKVQIVTRDGFWTEKDEMSQAYAQRATGDYLWQIDIDEFYKPEDMQLVVNMLADDPDITTVSFKQIQFWGWFSYWVDGWYLRRGGETFHRLFKWGPGYVYRTHRPPTVADASGTDVRDIKWIDAYEMERRGVLLYHYSLVFPRQAADKADYYDAATWTSTNKSAEWFVEAYTKLRRPYRVHNAYEWPSWLLRFKAEHPPEIGRLISELENGSFTVEMRPTDDVERLFRSPGFCLSRAILKALTPPKPHLAASGTSGRFLKYLRNPWARPFLTLEKVLNLVTRIT